MTIRPRLNVICGRCGKRREGLRHVCRSNSRRRATIRIRPVLGGCSRCGKTYGGRNGNPLTHVCNPRKGEFRQRKAARQRKARAAAAAQARAAGRDRQKAKATAAPRPRKPPHEYQSCTDTDCQRTACVAFREGYRDGDRDGYRRGYERGYDTGFPDGIAACPRAHK